MTTTPAQRCAECGHEKDDHDGYGGLCDGHGSIDDYGRADGRDVCCCLKFVPPEPSGNSGELPDPGAEER